MNIKIKNRWSGKIVLAGKYESIRDALEQNSRADLRGSDLSGADLKTTAFCAAVQKLQRTSFPNRSAAMWKCEKVEVL